MADSRTLGYERPRAGAHKFGSSHIAAWSQPSLDWMLSQSGTISAPAALECTTMPGPPEPSDPPSLIQTPVERRVCSFSGPDANDRVLKEVMVRQPDR